MQTLTAKNDIIPFDRATDPPPGPAYRFGDFSLYPALFELRRRGRVIPIAPKVFDLIRCLIENSHCVLTNADLHAAIWPGISVTDASLMYTVMAARRALGDSGRSQLFIRNVRSRGYRFVADVQRV